MARTFTLRKDQRLKSRKQIEHLFREGKAFSVFPFRVTYILQSIATDTLQQTPPAQDRLQSPINPLPAQNPLQPSAVQDSLQSSPSPALYDRQSDPPEQLLQAGFGASSRNFKRAVHRNRIKRLTREAFRLQRIPLSEKLTARGKKLSVFFIYIGKELPEYPDVTRTIGVILQKLDKLL